MRSSAPRFPGASGQCVTPFGVYEVDVAHKKGISAQVRGTAGLALRRPESQRCPAPSRARFRNTYVVTPPGVARDLRGPPTCQALSLRTRTSEDALLMWCVRLLCHADSRAFLSATFNNDTHKRFLRSTRSCAPDIMYEAKQLYDSRQPTIALAMAHSPVRCAVMRCGAQLCACLHAVRSALGGVGDC